MPPLFNFQRVGCPPYPPLVPPPLSYFWFDNNHKDIMLYRNNGSTALEHSRECFMKIFIFHYFSLLLPSLRLPTMFVAECVLVYMEPHLSQSIIRWAGTNFNTALFLNYEPVNSRMLLLQSDCSQLNLSLT